MVVGDHGKLRLEPFGYLPVCLNRTLLLLDAVADIHDNQEALGDRETENNGLKLLIFAAQAAFDKSYLQGLSQMFDAFQGEGNFGGIMGSTANNLFLCLAFAMILVNYSCLICLSITKVSSILSVIVTVLVNSTDNSAVY